MRGRMLSGLLLLFLCLFSVSCADSQENRSVPLSARDADISAISEATELSNEEAAVIYRALIDAGMSEGIKYVTEWEDPENGTFYRVRTSLDVFDVFIGDDGEISVRLPVTDSADEETALPLPETGDVALILNIRTKKYHVPECANVSKMSDDNKLAVFVADEKDMRALGYLPCSLCFTDDGTESE